VKLSIQEQILNQDLRQKLIEEINASSNGQRKAEAFKRYQCMKDHSDIYVMELLMAQFDAGTVREMQYALSNISIMRKIVDKIARVYANGVKRSTKKKTETNAIEEMAEQMKLNEQMRKVNKYLVAFRNALMYIRPTKESGAMAGKYSIVARPVPPFLYDVFSDPNDPEKPMVVVLSDYKNANDIKYVIGDAAVAARGAAPSGNIGVVRGVDATMVSQPRKTAIPQANVGVDTGQYIWWSAAYHFTTDAKGVIISGTDEFINPIGALPFVNYARDQDGSYWAEGGSDLADGSIRVNALLTNINHVSIQQGYGQLFMTGKNLPKSFKVGPNHALQLEYNEGDPTPTVGFLSANPPVGDLQKMAEMYVALLLTTNNLSVSGFSTSLSDSRQFASGVAMMIDKSELIEDITEQSELFSNREREVWKLIGNWHSYYKQRELLAEPQSHIAVPADADVNVAFPSPMTVLSENELLDIIQKRRDLGLSTEVELIQRDNPSLTEDEALAKIEAITAESKARMNAAQDAMGNQPTN